MSVLDSAPVFERYSTVSFLHSLFLFSYHHHPSHSPTQWIATCPSVMMIVSRPQSILYTCKCSNSSSTSSHFESISVSFRTQVYFCCMYHSYNLFALCSLIFSLFLLCLMAVSLPHRIFIFSYVNKSQ